MPPWEQGLREATERQQQALLHFDRAEQVLFAAANIDGIDTVLSEFAAGATEHHLAGECLYRIMPLLRAPERDPKRMVARSVFVFSTKTLHWSTLLYKMSLYLLLTERESPADRHAIDVAKEFASLSITMIRDIPALKPKHLLESSQILRGTEQGFINRFCPVFNAIAERYRPVMPGDQIPVLTGVG